MIAGEKLFSKRLWHRLRPPAVCRPWRPPRPSLPAAARRSPGGRWVLHSAAESNLSTAGVGGTTRGGSPAALSSRAVAVPDVHGRALRQEKGDDRRVVVGCCPRAARPGGRPRSSKSRSRQRRSRRRWPRTAARSPEAAARDVRRLGAGRNAAEMKFLSSLDLYVLSSLSPSLLLMEIILNKLETELIELLSSWCSCYGTWSATSNYFYNLPDLLPEVASSSIFSQ